LQEDVAARFRISRPRVTQIRRQMAAWAREALPAGLEVELRTILAGSGRARGFSDEALRLHLAIALWRLRLELAYGPYLKHFGGASGAQGHGHLLAARDAGVLPRPLAGALPERSLIADAVRMAREMEDLARVAERGPLGDLPSLLRRQPGAASSVSERTIAT
jgi:hypothetical protein